MSSRDYRRVMNFLAAHECGIGVREFRTEAAAARATSSEKSTVSPITHMPPERSWLSSPWPK